MKTFAEIPAEYAAFESAKVILIPVPYDGTSTWGKGADKGPEAFLEAAQNMEWYDIETRTEPYLNGIFLADPITARRSPEEMTAAVYQRVAQLLKTDKLLSLIGGEHSISIGAIRAFYQGYRSLTVVQIDAHADLRPTYLGSKYNHACALFEASQNTNLIQVGIRSMDESEVQYLDLEKTYFAQAIYDDDTWMESALKQMTDDVYITVDLDGFDPAILPSTGTPEPGGLQFYPVLKFLKMTFERKTVRGFDIVELAPNPADRASDFLAAKLYYKMLAYHFSDEHSRQNPLPKCKSSEESLSD